MRSRSVMMLGYERDFGFGQAESADQTLSTSPIPIHHLISPNFDFCRFTIVASNKELNGISDLFKALDSKRFRTAKAYSRQCFESRCFKALVVEVSVPAQEHS